MRGNRDDLGHSPDGFGDEVRDLKQRLARTGERKRRAALERAFAEAGKTAEEALKPLLEHRPFQEEVVSGLLDPAVGFDVGAAAEVWKDRFPEHARALRRFFTTLENALIADDTWGPILARYQQLRQKPEARAALAARHFALPDREVVRRVSLRVSGSGAAAADGGVAAGAGGVAVGGNVGQIVLQQIILQSGAAAAGDLRQRYLAGLVNRCRALPLAALGGAAAAHRTVTLDQV